MSQNLVVHQVIDYLQFQFAAPPGSGVDWFVQAAHAIGFGDHDIWEAYKPFPDHHSNFRLSIVRHPCDWLANTCNACVEDSVDYSIQEYLSKHSGRISKMFARYKADSYLRIEDMPEAFEESMEMFGVSNPERCRAIPLPVRPTIEWDPILRRRVLEAEREFCETYDYF